MPKVVTQEANCCAEFELTVAVSQLDPSTLQGASDWVTFLLQNMSNQILSVIRKKQQQKQYKNPYSLDDLRLLYFPYRFVYEQTPQI